MQRSDRRHLPVRSSLEPRRRGLEGLLCVVLLITACQRTPTPSIDALVDTSGDVAKDIAAGDTQPSPDVPDVPPDVPDVPPDVPDVSPDVPDVSPDVPDASPDITLEDGDTADIALPDADASPDPQDGGPDDDAPDGETNEPPSDTHGPDADASPEPLSNAEVFEALKGSCEGCHAGGSAPFFASFQAFEAGLVNNPTFIIPGDPAGSELLAILAGEGTKIYAQMPPGSASFADLAAEGKTDITMAALAAWIEGLSETESGEATAPTDVTLNRRQRAEQIVRSLYDLLGLEPGDFFSFGNWYGYFPTVSKAGLWKYPVRGPDVMPGFGVNSGNTETASLERFIALGGPDFGDGQRRDQSVGPTFLHTLTQTAQAHCRLALKKPGNTAVLSSVTLSDTTDTNPAGISANLTTLFLRFLGELPAPAELEALRTNVFEVYEALSGTTAAWVAVCATLIRDPRWITY